MTSNAVEKAHESALAGVTIDHEAILKSLNLNPRDPNTQALLLVCDRYGLDPLLKHMVLIKGNAYVTRDGYLTVAHRTGVFDGMEVLDQGTDGTHHWAKVAVYRKDMGRPFTYIGRYPKSGGNKEYGPEMAVKTAEVAALRRAFNVTGIGALDERWDLPDAAAEGEAKMDAALPPGNVDADTGEVAEPEPTSRRRPPPQIDENTGGGEPGEPASAGAPPAGAKKESPFPRAIATAAKRHGIEGPELAALCRHVAEVDTLEEITEPGPANRMMAAIKDVATGALVLKYADDGTPSWVAAEGGEVVQGELVGGDAA